MSCFPGVEKQMLVLPSSRVADGAGSLLQTRFTCLTLCGNEARQLHNALISKCIIQARPLAVLKAWLLMKY